MADEKKPATATTTGSAVKVLKTLDAISQPQSVKKFYVAYLTSDIVLAGLTYAVIMWIKIWAKASWESTWNNMWLYYLLFISIIVAKLNKAVTEYLRSRTVINDARRR